MHIRSVTLGTDVSYPLDHNELAAFEAFQEHARARFHDAGLEVQTVRLATQPFPKVLADEGPQGAAALAQELEAICLEHGIDYCSLGPVLATAPESDLSFIEAIPYAIRATDAAFASVLVAAEGEGINLEAIARSAEIISDIARTTSDGFGNLRLAVLANCGPGSPFFPVSYHGGGPTRFSIATEAADLAVDAFQQADSLADADARLRRSMKGAAEAIDGVAEKLETAFGFSYGGIDFCLAPFPETERSIGHALEQLGVDRFGSSGTLFTVAFLKRAIDGADFKRCGFSSVMLPVLEDTVLAQRSMDAGFSLDSLLLYSTVCGTGLDTIPLPGDVSVAEVAGVLLDMATLALVADKPLTARLMPIPGKEAEDVTAFDFEYFVDGRVMRTPGRGAQKLFHRDEFWAV